MFSPEAVADLLRQKKVRFVFAGISVLLALAGLAQLFGGNTPASWLKGTGNFLVWGALAGMNICKIYGRRWPANNFALAIGVLLLLASWVVKL